MHYLTLIGLALVAVRFVVAFIAADGQSSLASNIASSAVRVTIVPILFVISDELLNPIATCVFGESSDENSAAKGNYSIGTQEASIENIDGISNVAQKTEVIIQSFFLRAIEL